MSHPIGCVIIPPDRLAVIHPDPHPKVFVRVVDVAFVLAYGLHIQARTEDIGEFIDDSLGVAEEVVDTASITKVQRPRVKRNERSNADWNG